VLGTAGAALLVLGLLLGLEAKADCVGDHGARKTQSVHLVPQIPPAELLANWTPLLELVGRATGQCFEIRIAASIPAFEAALLAGEADFAFMNPYHQVMAKRRQGYVPLVRDDRGRLSGLLVVRKESPVTAVGELAGATLAFPAPNAFAASLLIRASLARQGVAIQPRWVKTHSNVYRAVAAREVLAGGGVNNTFHREPEGLRRELRVLWETPAYASHPFSAHPRVPEAVRGAVTAAFLALGTDSQARPLLERALLPVPVAADYSRDYKPLERLGLEEFVVAGGD